MFERENPKFPIRVKAVLNDRVMVTYIDPNINFDRLTKEIQELFNLEPSLFTIKFIDDEGDPCFLSNQEELDEVIRLLNLSHELEMTLRVFHGVQLAVGLPCPGEDSKYKSTLASL